MMTIIDPGFESTKAREATCWGAAIALHALLLLWNPILLRSSTETFNPVVTVDIVDMSTPGGPAQPEAPKKMSLMDTLKDMLSKPKAEDMAHIAPEPVVPKVAAPQQPMLQERNRPQPITNAFSPKSQVDDLAMAQNAAQINTTPRNATPLPSVGPTLKTKAFDGIRAKDLPFEISKDENITGAQAVPISVGKTAARNTINYAAPSLTNNKSRTPGIQPLTGLAGGGSASEMANVASAAPAQIALSGAGGSGNAPTGAKAGQVLSNRSGTSGGLVSRSMFPGGRGANVGSGIEGVPSSSRHLESESVGAGTNRKAAQKSGVDLEGPLANRGIVKKVIPQYPAWAEEQGIVGSVQLYFTVSPDGSVRPNIQVRKTTGYPNLDQLGIDALKQWKFAPLQTSDEKGEWGLITFNFSLSS